MSSLAIDQLFQITTPTPTGGNESRADRADEGLFRAHLEKATDVGEPKRAKPEAKEKPAPLEENEPLDTGTEHQEKSTTSQEEIASTTDASTQSTEEAEEAPPEEASTDEVTLSAAAAQVTTTVDEAAPVVEVTVEGTTAVDTSTTDQQQSDGQFAANFVETTEDAPTTTQLINTEEVDAALQSQAAAGEEAAAAESSPKSPNQTNAEQAKVATEIAQASANSAAQANTQQTQATAQSASTQSVSAGQQKAAQDPETTESKSTENSTKRFDRPDDQTAAKSVASDVISATEAELAKATQPTSGETSSAPSTSPIGNENTAAPARSLGNLAANKLADSISSPGKSSSTPETPTVDRARFVQRVGGAIRSAQLRDGNIQLRLSPPELGTLRIQLTVNEGGITAQLETENAAARTVLLDNLPALREKLAEQGMTIEKFDVDVGREGQQQADHPSAEERQSNNQRNRNGQTATQQTTRETTAVDPSNHSTRPTQDSGLDIRI